MATITPDSWETDSVRYANQAGTPSNPAAGYRSLFGKADGHYTVDENGVVTGPFLGSGSSTAAQGTILPSADVVPLTARGHASATASILQLKEGTTGATVVDVDGTGAVLVHLFTDIDTAFYVLNKAGTVTPLLVSTEGDESAVTVYATHEAVGAITDIRGLDVNVGNDSAGNVTNATGVIIRTPLALGGGTVANVRGLYVEDVAAGGTSNYSIYTNAGNVVFNGANGVGVTTIGGTPVSVNYDLGLVGDGVLMLKETTTPTADTNYGKVYTKSDNMLYFQDGAGSEHIAHGFPVFKSYNVTTQGLGANPDIYAGGFYEFSATDANLTQASLTQVFGTANVSYAAHTFIVTSGAGSVDAGVVGLRVNGTSIDDSGTRTTSDTETLLADITAAGANTYYEGKKWLGQVTFELFTVSGSPTTYSLDFNYGLAKYEDLGNNDFDLTDIEAVGFAGANDTNFNISLLHHKATGWSYSAAAFTPVIAANTIASLVGDHVTDDQLLSSENFAWKRSGLSTSIAGSSSEGVMFFIESSANSAVEYCNLHIGVEF